MSIVKTVLPISGMHCASCANNIAEMLKKVPGVKSAEVNYGTETAEILHGGKVSEDDLIAAVKKAGYDVKGEESPSSKKPLLVAIIAGIPLLLLAMGPMLGLPYKTTIETAVIQFILATIILIAGKNIFSSGILTVFRTKRANMDTLVMLGTGVAYLYSSFTLINYFLSGVLAVEQLYFESAGLIIVFILLGRHFESQAREKTRNSMKALLSMAPVQARKIVNKKEVLVPAEEIRVGDLIKIKPGDKIPVDGIITVGSSRVDESMLTGEPTPNKKTIRDEVFAGTINKGGMFFMKATHTGENTAYKQIVHLVEEAQRSKAPVQKLADQIASVFVPVVLVLALITFFVWIIFPPGDVLIPISFALTAGIAVLVIACPCALGLATPTAVMVGTGRAASKGILFKNAKSLQKAASVQMVAFDKTGTLTKGTPEVVYVKSYYDLSEEVVFRYAASLELGSEHPLGTAITQYADQRKINYGEPKTFESIEGKGISGKVEGRKILVGNYTWFREMNIGIYDVRERLPELAERNLTPVLVAVEGKLAGLIGIADPIRPTAKKAIDALHKQGIQTILLTGDHEDTARVVAHNLGIKLYRAQLLPKQKLIELKKLQKKRSVAMVGDGINDAPALAQADLGIAVSSGTDIAVETSDVTLIKDDLMSIPETITSAKKTMVVIKQNLWWAFGYNVLAIPVAAGVFYGATGWLLSPALAGGAMALSSLSVVLNSLRLTKT